MGSVNSPHPINLDPNKQWITRYGGSAGVLGWYDLHTIMMLVKAIMISGCISCEILEFTEENQEGLKKMYKHQYTGV